MDKKERIYKALAGQEVDYVPSGYWFHFPEEQSYGDEAVKAHLDFYKNTDVDLLKVMNEHLYRSEIDITSPSDWRRLKPLRAKHSFFREYLDIIRKIADHLSGEVPLLATIHGVFASTFHCCKLPGETIGGNNLLMSHLQEDPESVLFGFSVIADTLAEFSLACIDAGADGIYYAALGGEEHRFSDQEFLEYIKPFDVQVLNSIQKKCNLLILHICKDMVRLPAYSAYPGNAVNWAVHDGDYSLEDGQKIFNRAILGGLDDRSGIMIEGTEEDIRREVETIIGQFGKKGLILGCDCTLPTEIPIRKIRAAVEAARSIQANP